jgi:hypothetical protein
MPCVYLPGPAPAVTVANSPLQTSLQYLLLHTVGLSFPSTCQIAIFFCSYFYLLLCGFESLLWFREICGKNLVTNLKEENNWFASVLKSNKEQNRLFISLYFVIEQKRCLHTCENYKLT